MLFHVVMDFVVSSSVLQVTPEQGMKLMQAEVLPSLEKLSREKRVVAGGASAGSRSVILILEASSGEDLQEFLQGIPIWTRTNHTITLLQSFESRLAQDRKLSEQLVPRFEAQATS